MADVGTIGQKVKGKLQKTKGKLQQRLSAKDDMGTKLKGGMSRAKGEVNEKTADAKNAFADLRRKLDRESLSQLGPDYDF